jgi:citrate synthase
MKQHRKPITAISENKILVHGTPITRLIGTWGYVDALFWILKKKRPTESERHMVEAMLVACLDHGSQSPSTQVVRHAASTRSETTAAIAAGLNVMNHNHGGATEYAMCNYLAVIECAGKENITLQKAAEIFIDERLQKKETVEGFGHRFHSDDPRVRKLFSIAKQNGFAGEYVAVSRVIQRVLEKKKKKLTINIAGALGALLLELDIPAVGANLFFIIGRLPGMAAHYIDEYTHEKKMRKM